MMLTRQEERRGTCLRGVELVLVGVDRDEGCRSRIQAGLAELLRQARSTALIVRVKVVR